MEEEDDKVSLLDFLKEKVDFKTIHIRVDHDTSYDNHEIIWRNFPKYIIAREGDGQKLKFHSHIAVELPKAEAEDWMKGSTNNKKVKMTAFVKEHYPGVHGSMFSVEYAHSSGTLKSYVLKEGDFIFKGYSQLEIDTLASLSYSKDTKAFQEKLNILDSEFLLTPSMLISEWQMKFVDLKLEHKQHLPPSWYRAHSLMLTFMKHPAEKQLWIEYENSQIFKYKEYNAPIAQLANLMRYS